MMNTRWRRTRTAVIALVAAAGTVAVAFAAVPSRIDDAATVSELAERVGPTLPTIAPVPDVVARSCEGNDVAAAIAAAPVGGRVDVPAGSCVWSDLHIDKAVHLRGAGIALTTITATSNRLTKQPGGTVRLSDMAFERSGGGNAVKAFAIGGPWLGVEPVVIERNSFDVDGSGLFRVETPGGVVFADNDFSGEWDDSFIQLATGGTTASWTTADTMGDRDVDGRHNIYIEQNRFLGGTNQAIDCDNSVRCVYRHNVATYSSFNSHGLATSTHSVRHFEVYSNHFRHLGGTEQLAAQNWAVWIRGGTGVIFNNDFDDLAGGFWGDKAEVKLSIRGAEDARPQGSCAAVSYPVPQQLGQNHDGQQPFTDPIRLWGNTGRVEIDASWNWGNPCGLDFDDFFAPGRDIVDGTARPGYAPYVFPHPDRTNG